VSDFMIPPSHRTAADLRVLELRNDRGHPTGYALEHELREALVKLAEHEDALVEAMAVIEAGKTEISGLYRTIEDERAKRRALLNRIASLEVQIERLSSKGAA